MVDIENGHITKENVVDSPSSSRRTKLTLGSSAVIWKGVTPSGYSVVVARDERQRWVATVAGAARSTNASLEAALVEAGGSVEPRRWAVQLAAAIVAQTTA
jgi:hypothetical protein